MPISEVSIVIVATRVIAGDHASVVLEHLSNKAGKSLDISALCFLGWMLTAM